MGMRNISILLHRLTIPSQFYYYVIISNFFFRFFWTITITKAVPVEIGISTTTLGWIAATVEIVRYLLSTSPHHYVDMPKKYIPSPPQTIHLEYSPG